MIIINKIIAYQQRTFPFEKRSGCACSFPFILTKIFTEPNISSSFILNIKNCIYLTPAATTPHVIVRVSAESFTNEVYMFPVHVSFRIGIQTTSCISPGFLTIYLNIYIKNIQLIERHGHGIKVPERNGAAIYKILKGHVDNC
jgi:hypothetical protein